MKELQTEMKDLLKQEEESRKELLNLFKELGYGLE
jgi:type I restriction enzyme M protein